MNSYRRYLLEFYSDVAYEYGEEIDSDYIDDAYDIAKSYGISVLSDKDIYVVAISHGEVVGGLWVAWSVGEFSFDVVVRKDFQGKGIGKELVNIALEYYNETKEAYDRGEGTVIRVDVINQMKMKPLLLSKGFEVESEVPGHTIMIRESSTDVPEFIMLVGIPGSGKSYWISKRVEGSEYDIVSPDEIRKEITGDISDQTQNARVWEIAKNRVISSLKNKRNVILDSTMTSSSRRLEFIDGLPECKLKAKIFEIDPEISKKRIRNDIASGKDRSDVPDDIIDRMDKEMKSDIHNIEDEGFEIIK